VTAELAVAFPAVMLLLATVLAVGSVVLAQVTCLDAARAGARWAARGETAETVREVAGRAAPAGATVSVAQTGTQIRVVVTARVRLRALGLPLGPVSTISATATAPVEGAGW
jgi:Flp pilus assembly protein TadG